MLTLILGGARSGKSDLALRLASASGRNVLFVATMQPADDEMRSRAAAHRAQRPADWRVIEESLDLAAALHREARADNFVLIDCVTLWVSAIVADALGADEREDVAAMESAHNRVSVATGALLDWAASFAGHVAIVSNEVGFGLVPPYPLGRVFRDALGAANRQIAASADRIYYLVAGMVLDVRALGALPLEGFGRLPAHDSDL